MKLIRYSLETYVFGRHWKEDGDVQWAVYPTLEKSFILKVVKYKGDRKKMLAITDKIQTRLEQHDYPHEDHNVCSLFMCKL